MLGWEVVPQAVADARLNAQLNSIAHAQFFCDDLQKPFALPGGSSVDVIVAGKLSAAIMQCLSCIPGTTLHRHCFASRATHAHHPSVQHQCLAASVRVCKGPLLQILPVPACQSELWSSARQQAHGALSM